MISDGDKLKAIRNKYNLKQDEISGNDITRNLISEIETNKANITKRTAEVIIKNLKEIASKKCFKITETVEYLMENQLIQATKVLDDYINELKTLTICKDDSFIKVLKSAEDFIVDWDIKDKKIYIYELAGDYFFNHNEFYKEISYYERALELTDKRALSVSLLNILRKLSMAYGYIGSYEESIKCCEFALNRFVSMDKGSAFVFRHNNALNYKRLDNYKKAMENIKIAENIVDTTDAEKLFLILNSKGNCLYRMGRFKEAIDEFNKILSLIDKKQVDKYLTTIINIIDVYLKINMKDEAIEKLNFVISELESVNNSSFFISSIYFYIGKSYKELDKYQLSEDYYLKALDFAEKQKNYVLINDILGELIEVYFNVKDSGKMDAIKEKVFYTAIQQNKVNSFLIYKLIAFYTKENNSKLANKIANFALKFK